MLRIKTRNLKKYKDIVGESYIDELYGVADPLYGKEIVHINSTLYGGGVAMILNSLVPLMNELGISAEWHQIKGNPDFFVTTKMIHNALQGADIELTNHRKEIFVKNNELNAIYTHFEDSDCVIIHDPQPLPLITCYQKTQPWIWRIHIDISSKNENCWKFLKKFISKYDHMVISMEKYKQKIKMPQTVIMPSIDPFNYTNIELSNSEIDRYLKKYEIDQDKPIITQISRFDKWKDPLGVIKAFKIIREKFDCKLILLGNIAQDDPEGREIYNDIKNKAEGMKDVSVLVVDSSFLVNALQKIASVVIQKSIREGFALTVSEALWKGTPVVGSNVGGIPLQILDGKTGFLVNDEKECANRVLQLLNNPKLAEEIGMNGKEHVRKNFLITRHLMDYIKLLRREVIHYKVY
ncbi:MAG: glycosyltransferase [Candidatus Helarchaeota archaeon]